MTRKITLVTWSIIRYPELNSEFFELQGKYDPYNDGFLLTTIPYDFDSFDVESKIGISGSKSFQFRNRISLPEQIKYYLGKFIPTDEVFNEKLALQIIREWIEKENSQCNFKRGPVLSPCSCDNCDDETE